MIHISQISNEKIELYEEDGRYFLRLIFDYEDDYGYYKGRIERIAFDFKLVSIEQSGDWLNKKVSVDLGLDNKLPILPCKDEYFTLTPVKEKIHDMTIEEIEKKLGYKVRVIASK